MYPEKFVLSIEQRERETIPPENLPGFKFVFQIVKLLNLTSPGSVRRATLLFFIVDVTPHLHTGLSFLSTIAKHTYTLKIPNHHFCDILFMG